MNYHKYEFIDGLKESELMRIIQSSEFFFEKINKFVIYLFKCHTKGAAQ